MATEIWSLQEAERIARSEVGQNSFLLVRRIDRLRDASKMRNLLEAPPGGFPLAVLNLDEVRMAARLDERLEELERAVKDVVGLYGGVESLNETGAKVSTAEFNAFRLQFEDRILPEVDHLSLYAYRAASGIRFAVTSFNKLLDDLERLRGEKVDFVAME